MILRATLNNDLGVSIQMRNVEAVLKIPSQISLLILQKQLIHHFSLTSLEFFYFFFRGILGEGWGGSGITGTVRETAVSLIWNIEALVSYILNNDTKVVF